MITINEIEKTENIAEIAKFIQNDWQNISPHAKVYLTPMTTLKSINDNYFYDDAKSIIRYFLANARSYRGENAKIVKKRLNKLLEN